MEIVDSQVHLWRGGLPPVGWHRQVVSFDADAALVEMDDAGVRAAMINPPNWGDDDLALASDAVGQHPHRFGIVRTVPIAELPHPANLSGWSDQGGVLGLRFVFLREPAITWMSNGALDGLWSRVEERYSSGPYPFDSMHPYLKETYDAFGPDRMFWGTDISKMRCSWRECVTMFTEELPWLAGDDLTKVMGAAVRAWWGWRPDEPG